MPSSPHVPALTTALSAVLASLLLMACGTPPSPPALPSALPAHWSSAPAADMQVPAADLQSWWTSLGDPQLDTLVQRALAQNLTLAQARSRIRQARLLAGRDSAQFLPVLALGARTVQDAAAIDNYAHVGLDATWELGLFGLRESVDHGARSRVDQAVAGEQAARVSVVAEVVRQYLLLRGAQQDLALAQRLLALDDRALGLHEIRQRTRTGAMDERRAVELRRAQTEAGLATPRQAAAASAQALAVLLAQTGVEPAWTRVADAPDMPPAPAAFPAAFRLRELPFDLLRYRPDVRQAEAEVARAAAELGIARADLYPRITLGLSHIYAYNLTQNRRNVSASLPAIGPVIDIPLFDWNRRRAAADAREEALAASLLAYRQALVEAYGETETALSALARAGERSERLTEARRLQERQLAQQAVRERLGLASALERLDAERGLLQADVELAAARSAGTQAFVLLYRTLGGAPLADAMSEAPR